MKDLFDYRCLMAMDRMRSKDTFKSLFTDSHFYAGNAFEQEIPREVVW